MADEFCFRGGEAGGEGQGFWVGFKEGLVEDAGGEVGSFFGGVAAVFGVEFLTEFGVLLAEGAPGVADGSKGGLAGFGGGGVVLADSFLHYFVGGELFGVLFVAIASSPGLVKDGSGSGGIDDFVEAKGCFFEAVGEEGRGLALVLKDDDVEVAGFDFFGGGLIGEVEGEGFSAGVDEGELGVGMGGGFDEFGDGFTNTAGVAVADEEDFFWLRGSWGFGGGLRYEGGEGEEQDEESGLGGHCEYGGGLEMLLRFLGFLFCFEPGLSFGGPVGIR